MSKSQRDPASKPPPPGDKKPADGPDKRAESGAAKSAAPASNDTIKETLESVVIAFILAFVFRAYIVEAFVIPTGSMAPTLLGEHLGVTCSQCGYDFAIDLRGPGERPSDVIDGAVDTLTQANGPGGVHAACPMCKYQEYVPKGARTSSGDRILVHKYIYSVSKPRRWDVVVFKNPQMWNNDDSRGPTTNYIKRLIGLPGEHLQIIEGNIYVRRAESDDPAEREWRIARKTDRPDVQEAVWQPIYHSRFVPLDGGWTEGLSNRRWWLPWHGDMGDWQLPAQVKRGESVKTGPNWTAYRLDSVGRGRLAFGFKPAVYFNHDDPSPYGEPQRHQYAYNVRKVREGNGEPIEDIRLAVALRPDQDGLSLMLRTTARFDDESTDSGGDVLGALIKPDGRVTFVRRKRLGADNALTSHEEIGESAQIDPLPTDRTTQVEFWFVDQEASLWVNGERVLRQAFDMDIDHVRKRRSLSPNEFPSIAIEVDGSPVTLFNVELDRDLYYSASRAAGNGGASALGGVSKDAGKAPIGESPPLELHEAKPGDPHNNEYYCLGDNSPSSLDGRFWHSLDPWVRQKSFDGKDRFGVVPEDLLMGRAFFVYFPAPRRFRYDSRGIFVNFGDLRFID